LESPERQLQKAFARQFLQSSGLYPILRESSQKSAPRKRVKKEETPAPKKRVAAKSKSSAATAKKQTVEFTRSDGTKVRFNAKK
jgi:hypothetical protein